MTGACGDGNGRRGPALVTSRNKGTHGNGNGGGGPVLAMDERRKDNKNGNVRGDLASALGKETLYWTDATARAAADDALCSHE